MNTRTQIPSFRGPWLLLSNFYPVDVVYEGITYPSVEHAFVAAKTTDEIARRQVLCYKYPGDAKRYGRSLVLRDDWDTYRVTVMRDLLTQKFSQEPFRTRLLETGLETLEEGNTWGDTFWGSNQNAQIVRIDYYGSPDRPRSRRRRSRGAPRAGDGRAGRASAPGSS
jgi:ribA/ribD-fused uncharacterized protein